MWVGVDIGKEHDNSVFTVINERLQIVSVEIMPVGSEVNYRQIVNGIDHYCIPATQLFIDNTGVGAVICSDLKIHYGDTIKPVNITSGQSVKDNQQGGYNVPKRMLLQFMQDVMTAGLQFACGCYGR